MDEGTKGLLIAGAALLGSGAVLVALAAFFYSRTRTFLTTAVDAMGTVVGHTTSSGSEGGTVYHPVVSFQAADGREIQFEDRMGSNPPSHQVGEAVEIKYDPARPEKARLSGTFRLYFVPGLLTLIGGPFVIAGAGLLVAAAAT